MTEWIIKCKNISCTHPTDEVKEILPNNLYNQQYFIVSKI